ncbi:NDUFB9, NADH-ubiquinone oxidoreductase [Serpula lacrymans var. lacrymans S7.9]|uniref:NADH dehydrogenase [ubiquinone] 1 beta subcomplex subunit 9 n=1 Tax=Serpula lacrymans var. lacrymans (strain S7.9) TaxID=578457 RepID=F8NNU3_SERL9|nr:NDUFB9, NADH-ubiquinone oxidoreductase [Serpula lacrymans var. lacrymans S7.9]EGO27615.1 NDUFB9, NADH-ubiquinone oxidoreductase [Serpula lacrymans var. lacrymans S7.9]
MSTSPFTSAHRLYVKSLYRRMLKNELDWVVRRDLWRGRAMLIRAEFERNRDVSDPRALAVILEKAEADLASKLHPDPYIPPTMPGGTKWERNIPPTIAPLFDHTAVGHH